VQALAILFGAGFTVLVATALGALVLGARCREYPVRFVVGSAILSLAVFVLCALHLVYWWVFLTVGAVSLAACPRRNWRRPSLALKLPAWTKVLFGVVLGAYFLIYFFHSMAPEASPDGSTYHLGLVNLYLEHHGFEHITWSLYANLSQGAEMLFLFAFAFGKHSAAAMVHFAFLVALVWEMLIYGRRIGIPLAALCGAVLLAASPVVAVDATSAYNDVALAAVGFTVFLLLEIWQCEPDGVLLAATGLVAGFAYATKYTGGVAVIYALATVAWKSPRWRRVAVVAGCAGISMAPWMIKNWLSVQNPVSPFFNHYFPNQYITGLFERDYTGYLALYDLPSRWSIPLQATMRGGLGGILGPVFLLAPIALLSLRRPEGRKLLLAFVVFGATYFSNIGTRFLILPLPFLALAMALAVSAVPALVAAVALVHAVISWPAIVPRYSPPAGWRLAARVPWREALRLRDADRYLTSRRSDYAVARLVERATAPGATIFSYRAYPWAYTSRRLILAHESAEGETLDLILRSGFEPDREPTWHLAWQFPRQQLRGVRVLQTATGSDVWSVSELRIFDGDGELPRAARWRLTAHPFPWHIQDAFDNSPLTFWRCGDSIHPDMYIEVEFGTDETATGVRIEAAPDQYGIRLQLEGRQPSGAWTRLAATPETFNGAAPLGLRLAVAEELKRRGVDNILLFDDDSASADFRRNPDLWGVRQIGEAADARLYQIQ
jgi:hypothetical protein